MKVIVGIPEEVLEHPHNYCCYALANQIKGNYTPIPDNATNGDMIKAMFPYAIKSNYIESGLDMADYVEIYLGDYLMRVSYDWWDALYRKVEE